MGGSDSPEGVLGPLKKLRKDAGVLIGLGNFDRFVQFIALAAGCAVTCSAYPYHVAGRRPVASAEGNEMIAVNGGILAAAVLYRSFEFTSKLSTVPTLLRILLSFIQARIATILQLYAYPGHRTRPAPATWSLRRSPPLARLLPPLHSDRGTLAERTAAAAPGFSPRVSSRPSCGTRRA